MSEFQHEFYDPELDLALNFVLSSGYWQLHEKEKEKWRLFVDKGNHHDYHKPIKNLDS